ncbi:MAG: lysophospholipid acyltransferase family protein [Bacillota bacterium]
MTCLFLLFLMFYAALFVHLFDAFSLEALHVLVWGLSLLVGFLLALLTILLLYTVYGRFQKGDQTMNLRNHRFIGAVLPLILRLLRVKLHVTGKANIPNRNFILVANHQSYYEVVALKHLIKRPMVYIAKRPVFTWPIVGHWAKLTGNVPIDRIADRSAAEAIIKGIRQYKKGASVAIFPEGKRSYSNTMNPMRPGAFKLATKPKAPILVATIHDFHKVWKGWPLRRQHLHVHFHEPLWYEDYKAMNTVELAKHVQSIIEAKLKTFERDQGV